MWIPEKNEALEICSLFHLKNPFPFRSVVEFASKRDLKDAIRKLDGTELNGKRIRIIDVSGLEFTVHKQQRPGLLLRNVAASSFTRHAKQLSPEGCLVLFWFNCDRLPEPSWWPPLSQPAYFADDQLLVRTLVISHYPAATCDWELE